MHIQTVSLQNGQTVGKCRWGSVYIYLLTYLILTAFEQLFGFGASFWLKLSVSAKKNAASQGTPRPCSPSLATCIINPQTYLQDLLSVILDSQESMNTVVKQECLRLALGTTHFLLDLVSLVLPWDFQLCGGRIMLHISLDSRKASRAQKSQDTNGRILLPVSFNTNS